MSGPGASIDDGHTHARARFEAHRRAWDANPALRELYARWYGMVRAALPPRERGPWIELGSGPGFAAHFIPELVRSDLVRAPWLALQVGADRLPFGDGRVGALVLFDVLHHLPAPAALFAEAARVLPPGGRLVLCEPYIGPLSRVVYGLFHEEPVRMGVDPYAAAAQSSDDPFDANQAIPTLMLLRRQDELARRFPGLRLLEARRLAGLAYPASGGFSRGPLLPVRAWRALLAIEDRLPPAAFRLLGFRLFAVVERRSEPA